MKLLRSLGLLALVALATSRPSPAAIHPGILHTQADFNRMIAKVNANAQPWKGGWDKLVASPHSQSTWTPRATATIIRGGTGDNVALLYNDVQAAYQNALRWKISGSTAHGDKARDILNAWSGTMTTLSGNADRFLAAGIFGYQFANAAEIMRGYPGFDLNRFKTLMTTVFYPLNNQFLLYHNDACITNYWANWDLCNMASILAIGILCDDNNKINQAITYFKTGAGNGSINKAVWYMHNATQGQWQESGRDQGHAILGVGLMAAFCEMAWNQGHDLYGWNSNRFLAGAEYVARYNNFNTVPFATYNWGSGQNCSPQSHTVVSAAGRGEDRPIWEMIYHHYANRMGLAVPNVAAAAAELRPEGGPGGHATTFDQPGFGSLTFARDPLPSTAGFPAAGTWKLRCRSSGLMLDNLGVSSNGATVGQWGSSASSNQRWVLSYISANVVRLRCVTGDRYLDGMGATTNGSNVAQWGDSASDNQRWTLIDAGGGYFKLKNVATNLCLDIGAGPWPNGDVVQQYPDGTSQNMQWQFVAP